MSLCVSYNEIIRRRNKSRRIGEMGRTLELQSRMTWVRIFDFHEFIFSKFSVYLTSVSRLPSSFSLKFQVFKSKKDEFLKNFFKYVEKSKVNW